MATVIVDGPFDGLNIRDIRFLEAIARHGPVHVMLHPDRRISRETGKPPKFAFEERQYLLQAIRFVTVVRADDGAPPAAQDLRPDGGRLLWAIAEWHDESLRASSIDAAGRIGAEILMTTERDLPPLPPPPRPAPVSDRRPKVIVTGCYDWLHSGHVRFFEEASGYGELYVVVGSDANVRMLKGPGHPMFGQDERRYMVASIRNVSMALISSGSGWLDARPEIEAIRPDCYIVNEDGDKPEKRAYCAACGMKYIVLRRAPRPGLPPRKSTELRGY